MYHICKEGIWKGMLTCFKLDLVYYTEYVSPMIVSMKKIYLLPAILAVLVITSLGVSHAREIDVPDTVTQGKVIRMEFLAGEVTSPSVSTGKYSFFVDPYYRVPGIDESISRAEAIDFLFSQTGSTLAFTSTGSTFADVPQDSRYRDAIERAYLAGVVSGREVGYFYGGEPLTRAEFAKIVAKSMGLSADISQYVLYPDLNASHPLSGYINAMRAYGIMKGYPDGLFRPDREITYREIEIVLSRVFGKTLTYARGDRKYYQGYIAFHRTDEKGVKDVTAKGTFPSGRAFELTKRVNVKKGSYITQSFSMSKTTAQLFADTLLTKTWELIDGAKKNPIHERLWEGAFIVPTKGDITVHFGDILYINGVYIGSHFGIDYAGARGTAIVAPNNGVVVLSSSTASYGNVVIIDHGQNIFTMYLHCDILVAKVGDSVTKGQKIATIGSTGLSTGPHLHFTQFVGDVVVDSREFYSGLVR